jgi:hypothetical protein
MPLDDANVEATAETAETVELLREQIAAILATSNLTRLRRIKSGLVTKRRRASHQSVCLPRREPLMKWTPKHRGLAQTALRLIQEGTGIKSAPFTVGPTGWAHKFFAADVAQRLVHGDENEVAANDERSEMAKSAITVSSLTARIVEEANVLKATEGFGDARLEMQTSRQDAGWSKATTRGSGVVMNDAGKRLFAAAADRLADRMVVACAA